MYMQELQQVIEACKFLNNLVYVQLQDAYSLERHHIVDKEMSNIFILLYNCM